MARFTCNVISYILKRAVDITVIIPSPTIPEALNMSKDSEPIRHTPKEKYPVLYLLHGSGNSHAQWAGYTNVELYAEEQNIAVVSISAENKAYIKVGNDDFYRFFSEELPDFVCGLFPISNRPEDTYIAGLSMGGYGTWIHGLGAPERFAAMGVFSVGSLVLSSRMELLAGAGNETVDFSALSSIDEGEPAYNPVWLAENIKKTGRKFPPIYYACGTEDFLFQGCITFRDKLKDLGADVTWDEMEGYGHEWRFWDIEIEKFLNWLPRTDYYHSKGKRAV